MIDGGITVRLASQSNLERGGKEREEILRRLKRGGKA